MTTFTINLPVEITYSASGTRKNPMIDEFTAKIDGTDVEFGNWLTHGIICQAILAHIEESHVENDIRRAGL